jgi:hypothetical protein
MSDTNAADPTPESLAAWIVDTFSGVDVVTAMNAWFFSLDGERHFPNFATIVTTDEHDDASNLSRPGVFRLNLGVTRATFERLVAAVVEPDYTALDRVIPHPVYARQHWVSILNPSAASFESIVRPLVTEAYDRLATQRARRA